MASPRDHLHNARTCEARAAAEPDPKRRETWLRMARQWRERAEGEAAEKRSAPGRK